MGAAPSLSRSQTLLRRQAGFSLTLPLLAVLCLPNWRSVLSWKLTYEVVKTQERLGNRFREEQARAKLAAQDLEFQQKMVSKKKKRRVKREKVLDAADDIDDADEEVSDDVVRRGPHD